MSSLVLKSRQQKPEAVEWARLIPGENPLFRAGRKKPSRSVTPISVASVAEIATEVSTRSSESVWTLLQPRPLQSRTAWKWVCSVAADFALVAMNWLLIGALQVPLRALFPHTQLFRYAAGAPSNLLGIALLQAALITLIGYAEGLHTEDGDQRAQARILGKSILGATALLWFASGLHGTPWATSSLFCGAGLLHFGMLWTWRRQSATLHRRSPQSSELSNVLIVGAGSVGRRVASYVQEHPETGRSVCGFLDDEGPLSNKVIGRVNDLARLSRTRFVDAVILAAPHDQVLTRQVLCEAQRLRLDVEIVPDLFGCQPVAGDFAQLGDLPVICLHSEQLPSAGLVLKRLVDLLGAGLALTILSPLLGAIAGLIKLDSRGPVLYCAQRAGRKGRLFRCYKFRTMVSNADELKDDLRQNNQRSGPFFKIANDPRITRVGRLLRRYSLDELPQLGNVLKGNMSLVGPRPHPVDDVAGYEIEHLARLDVTPGITGLWQVSARRDPSFERGMELDREYIRTWSVLSDMRILLRTFLVVVRGGGD